MIHMKAMSYKQTCILFVRHDYYEIFHSILTDCTYRALLYSEQAHIGLNTEYLFD
jgi:hypothetical protein